MLLQWKYVRTDNKAGLPACILFIYLHIIVHQCVDSPALIWQAVSDDPTTLNGTVSTSPVRTCEPKVGCGDGATCGSPSKYMLHLTFLRPLANTAIARSAEIFPTTLKAKGISLGLFAYFVGGLTYATPAAVAFNMFVPTTTVKEPILTGSSKYGMYLVFMALCIISAMVVYFYIPETKLKPVEELEALFGDEVVVHLTDNGLGIVEEEEVEGGKRLSDSENVALAKM
jgi:hypothetical protein